MSFSMLKPIRKATSSTVKLAPRSASLEGKVLGTLWNNRANGDRFLQQLGEELRKRYRVSDVIHKKKIYNNTQAPRALLEALRERCDAVVVGVGD